MAFLTLDEFAAQCGMEKKNIWAYTKDDRKQVVLSEGNMVDMAEEKNRLFVNKQRVKRGLPDLPSGLVQVAHNQPRMPVKSTVKRGAGGDVTTQILIQSGASESGDAELSSLDKRQRLLDLQKTEQEIIEKTIKNQKLSGSVVPLGIMQPLLNDYNKNMVESFKNVLEELLTAITTANLLDSEQVAYWRGEIIRIINEASDKAIETTVKALQGIIAEFSASRGVGEKG